MAPRQKSRFWRLCRIYFRRFRICIWLLILLLLGSVIYLNQVGLPGFFKRPLLEKLRARGIDLQFSRLRWRWYEGIVAENVRFGQAADALGPQVTAAEVQLQLNYRALSRLQLQVDSLALKKGSVSWTVAGTNQPTRQIAVQDIQTDLRLLAGDQWRLEHFTAGLAGARIVLSGAVTNASAVRDWKLFHAAGPSPAGLWERRLRNLADSLEQIRFSAPPELRLDVRGDARDLLSFKARMFLNSPGAETPWGSFNQGKFTLRLAPGGTGDLSHAEITLEAADARSEWAVITNLHLNVQLVSPLENTSLINGECSLKATSIETRWANATNATFDAKWTHSLTNPIPFQGRGELKCASAHTQWGDSGQLQLTARLISSTNTVPDADGSWSTWLDLSPYILDWQLALRDLQSPKLAVSQLSCSGLWRAPELVVSNLQANLYDGTLTARADINVGTRALRADLASTVDPHKLNSVLTEGANRFLDQFGWTTPPIVNGRLSMIFPSWMNRAPDWRAEVQPTLRIDGHFQVAHGGAFRGVPVNSARSDLVYSNMVWILPDLVAIRPEGRVEASLRSDDRSKNFYWHLSSTIDPKALKPLLETNVQRGLDLFTFKQSPALEAEIWGRWHAEDRIGLKGRVALTNFSFRGETADGFQSAIQYTNGALTLTGPEVQRGPQRASAEELRADFKGQKIYLTNGFSTLEPMVVARAIGRHVVRAIEPYVFSNPPIAHVSGVIPTVREEDADLHFEVEGGPFHWWNFDVPRISGEVHWVGKSLSLTNVHADFYGGRAVGSAGFNFSSSGGADYHFGVAVSDVILEHLMADLSPRKSRLEGLLNAKLIITRGNLSSARNFNGYGEASLRDGLIWAIPIFGVFSEPLDALWPGLGKSRASAGSGNFVITNGVIWSHDLEIRSPAMRLEYDGAVDVEGKINANVEALMFHDIWLFGPIVSSVFLPFTKTFEWRMSGSLAEPKIEPLFFGKFVPLHPFRNLREPAFSEPIPPPPPPHALAPNGPKASSE